MPSARRAAIFILLATMGLAACENTVRGVGRDMQETGEAVEDTVQGNP